MASQGGFEKDRREWRQHSPVPDGLIIPSQQRGATAPRCFYFHPEHPAERYNPRMTNIQSLARKITFFLFVEQSLTSAGFIAVATLNSIVSEKLGNHAGWAGVPTAVYLLAGALAAFGWGYVF